MLRTTVKLTECHLNVRSNEHLGKRVGCKPSAVSLKLHNHDSDFKHFTILCRDNNGSRLLLKESVLISTDSPVFKKNTTPISLLLFD